MQVLGDGRSQGAGDVGAVNLQSEEGQHKTWEKDRINPVALLGIYIMQWKGLVYFRRARASSSALQSMEISTGSVGMETVQLLRLLMALKIQV